MKKLVLSFLALLLFVVSTTYSPAPATAATKYDFKNVNWGMTVNQIKKKEKSKLLDTTKIKDISLLEYKTTGFRVNAKLVYIFYKNKLVRAVYEIYPNDSKKTTMDKYYKYFSIKRDLFDEYDGSINFKDGLTPGGKRVLYDSEDVEKDLVTGAIALESNWVIDKKKTSISLMLARVTDAVRLRVIYTDYNLKYDLDELIDAQKY
ncbi:MULTISPECIES: hypothetical protein [Paenibacillus]|uniref:hypothetical protein n=1 Tax=Paenibacillus TaxID=44249 RepID=UPI00088D8878|nr:MULTISPECIES: hypothetical protein [Paenibacillus]MCL6659761.1 hypothetical protein [Paenibacillus amylolyticus]SDC89462.1 hypothetical protein SAMN05428987_3220 [Paenibacillus sp. CF095]